jgi:hypothetical protein
MKPAIFMAIIPLSSMGLVNVALADDSPPPSTTGEQPSTTVIDSSSKTQPSATAESPFSIGSIFSSHFGNDHFGATVGYKAWYNTWDLPLYISGGGQHIITNVGSGTEISHIPVVSLRYKNFFVSGSYFLKTDYNLSKIKIANGIGSSYSTTEYSIFAERSEWDITTGYYVSQNIAITFGYKNIRRDNNYLIQDSLIQFDDRISEHKRSFRKEIRGLTLGLTSSVSLGRGFGLYEIFAYGRLSPKGNRFFSIEEDNFSIPYYLGEMGLVYSIRLKNPTINAASFYAGYRFQRIDFEERRFAEQTGKDRTDGFVFGVNLSF